MNKVRLMAEAAETPKKPKAKTWLASNAPNPPGNGTRNESQPAVHAATVCQKDKWIWRKDVIRKYSLTMPNAAINETSDAASKARVCRWQNRPDRCSAARMKRITFV